MLNVLAVGACFTNGLFFIWKSAFNFLTFYTGIFTAADSSAVGSYHYGVFTFSSPLYSKNFPKE
jgi:hypothetical protein